MLARDQEPLGKIQGSLKGGAAVLFDAALFTRLAKNYNFENSHSVISLERTHAQTFFGPLSLTSSRWLHAFLPPFGPVVKKRVCGVA